MFLLAGMPGLEWIILALVAPTVAVLLLLSFRFATTARQRMVNLLSGFVCTVIAIITFVVWDDLRLKENSDNSAWVFGVAPLGAVCGVALAKSIASLMKRL